MTPFDERSKIEHKYDTVNEDDCQNPNITDAVKEAVRSYYETVSAVYGLRAGCGGESGSGSGGTGGDSRVRRVGGTGVGIVITVVFESHADFQAARAIMELVPTAVAVPVGAGGDATAQLSDPPIAFDATQYSPSELYCAPLISTAYTFGGDVCADSTFFCCFDSVCSACMGASPGALPGHCTTNRLYQGYVLDCSTSCGDGLDRGDPSGAACLLALNELQLADALGVAPDLEVEELYNASNCSCAGDAITAALDCYVSNSSTSPAAPAVVPELFLDPATALLFWFEAETQCGPATVDPDTIDSDLQEDLENAFTSEVVLAAIISTAISALLIAVVVAALLRGQRKFNMKRLRHRQYSPEMVMAMPRNVPGQHLHRSSFQAELYPEGFMQDRLGLDPSPGMFQDFDGLPTRGLTVHAGGGSIAAARKAYSELEADGVHILHGDEEGDGYGLVGDILTRFASAAPQGAGEEEDLYDNDAGLPISRPGTVWSAEPSAVVPPKGMSPTDSIRWSKLVDAADAGLHGSHPAELAADEDDGVQDVPAELVADEDDGAQDVPAELADDEDDGAQDVPRFAPPIPVTVSAAAASREPPLPNPVHRTRLSDGQLNI